MAINKAWVGKNTDPAKLAASIAIQLNNKDMVEVSAIGEEAVLVLNKALNFVSMFTMRDGASVLYHPEMRFSLDKKNKQRTVQV